MFEVNKICDRIYHIQFDDHYQLCMHFLRYQESYESPKFNGKNFELIDLIEWYSKKYGKGLFTYPKDWGGFNLPGCIILDLDPQDSNRYDRLMKSIAEYIKADVGDDRFYVIGTKIGVDIGTFKHEIAHALYYVDSDYHREITECYDVIPVDLRNKLTDALSKMGYDGTVIIDEIQAYMATGLIKQFGATAKKYQGPFKTVFNRYMKQVKLD